MRQLFYSIGLTFVVMAVSNGGLAQAESGAAKAGSPVAPETKVIGIQDYLSLGVLFVSNQEPYKGLERENRFFPSIGLQYKKLTVFGPVVKYQVFAEPQKYSLSLLGEFKFFDGYKAGDALELTGMDERKGTAYLGARFSKFLSPLVQLDLSFVQDVLSEHGGATGKVSIGARLPFSILLGRLFGTDALPFSLLSTKVGIKYYSTKYVNYYFGVKDFEITPERSGYFASDGFAFFTQMSLWVQVSPRISWTNMYRLEFLPSDIKNSPLVGRSKTSFFLTSLSYLFFL